jgi:shikimate dehydrogenase
MTGLWKVDMVSALKFGLLGHPVGHSVSPAIHQAAYDAFGLPHTYSLCDCPTPSDVEHQVEQLRQGLWAGLNVTVPWKRLALQLADDLDDSARETGAANVLLRQENGRIIAHNTDAPALGQLLAAGSRTERPKAALVLGNGGAALAAVVAARRAGCARVYVSARRWSMDAENLGAVPVSWSSETIASTSKELTLLVQATSAGMRGVGGGEELASVIPWQELPSDVFAYDVVYNPENTPFLERARAAQLRAEGGLSMLVGQAALAFELWLGLRPPTAQLMDHARAAIFGGEVSHR